MVRRAATEADGSRSAAVRWLPAALGAAVVAVHVAMAVAASAPVAHTGGDNAAYLSLANSLAQHGTYAETWHPGSPPHAKYPPAYPAALAIMILAGAKTWSAFKALSVVWTGLAAGFCFLWLRRRTELWTAAALSLLLAVSPALLYASQWVLSDPMFVALTLASLWLLTPYAAPPRAARTRPRNGPRRRNRGRRRASSSARSPSAANRPELRLEPRTWTLAAGLALAVAAWFTRSAGLPLVMAAAVFLALERRWKALAGFAALFALPAVLWQLRPGGEYAAEFLLVNPYEPDLGRAGPADLARRVGENLWRYAALYVPGGLAGVAGALGTVAGLLVTGLALGGWFRGMRRRPGVAECFFALYAGLVLLWPVQWSGDRFALPLFPLMLFYAAEALAFLGRRAFPAAGAASPAAGAARARRALAAVAVALLAVPSVWSWSEGARAARGCRPEAARAGPMACVGGAQARGFHALAVWAGRNLPEESIVFSRKPRLFHVFSGLQSVVFPFSRNDSLLLAQADSLGARYVLRAGWDRSVLAYVDPVVRAHPDRFCQVTGLSFGADDVGSLLAIKSAQPDDVQNGPTAPGGPARVEVCPEWAGPQQLPSSVALSSMIVPILDP